MSSSKRGGTQPSVKGIKLLHRELLVLVCAGQVRPDPGDFKSGQGLMVDGASVYPKEEIRRVPCLYLR